MCSIKNVNPLSFSLTHKTSNSCFRTRLVFGHIPIVRIIWSHRVTYSGFPTLWPLNSLVVLLTENFFETDASLLKFLFSIFRFYLTICVNVRITFCDSRKKTTPLVDRYSARVQISNTGIVGILQPKSFPFISCLFNNFKTI